tara:strand:- start:781 stop:1833 length:1053 start_codon:yes stop_codon:yes gene_type:complete
MIIKEERVAIVSDLHIGKHQNSSKWHNIALDFAEDFRARLKKDNIKDIIICGDVNNDREEICVQSLHVVNEIFTLWKDFNINIIVGNHDAYYKNRSDVNSLSIFSGWSNIHIIDETEVFNIFGKRLVFCPWGADVEQVPVCDYLFGHLEINGFSLTKMKVCTNGTDSFSILDKAKMTISGHFHLREDRKYKDGRILYVGSPYEMDWGDCGTGSRGFHYLDIPSGDYEFIENKRSPKHKKIRMSEITSAGKITQAIIDEFKGNFVSFIVDHEIKDMHKFNEFLDSLVQYGARSIKPYFELESRVSLGESEYNFTAVNVKSSIDEFIKMSDFDDKESILEEMYGLYDKCTKE